MTSCVMIRTIPSGAQVDASGVFPGLISAQPPPDAVVVVRNAEAIGAAGINTGCVKGCCIGHAAHAWSIRIAGQIGVGVIGCAIWIIAGRGYPETKNCAEDAEV